MSLKVVEEWTIENGKAICNISHPLYTRFKGLDINDGKAFLHELERRVNAMLYLKAFWIK